MLASRTLRLAVIALLTAPFAPVRAQIAQGFDVLGIPIDGPTTDAEASLKKEVSPLIIRESQGTMTIGSYKSPQLVFGFSASPEGGDSTVLPNGATTRDTFVVAYSLTQPQTIIGIQRNKSYATNDAPTMENMFKSLDDKYGQGIRSSNSVDWQLDGKKLARFDMMNCSNQVSMIVSLERGDYRNPIDEKTKACGKFIHVWVDANTSNPNLVGAIRLSVIDFGNAWTSYSAITKSAEDAARGAASQQNEHAAGVKSKL